VNTQATKHLAKAKDYVARGEEFYRKAAEEIVAAQEADPTLGQREIAESLGRSKTWVQEVVSWSTTGRSTRGGREDAPTPYAEQSGAVAKRHAKAVARHEPETLIEDPEARQSLGRALDEHYTKRATEAAGRRREREVERKGGEDEHAEHERRQHVAEVVNVIRGAASGLRFAAGQAKGLALDEDDSGAADELTALLDEIDGFSSMLRAFLRGHEITDEDLAELIGGQA
jgi:hypothetical protein